MSDFPSPLHLSLLTPDVLGATGGKGQAGVTGVTGQAGATGTIYFNDLNLIHSPSYYAVYFNFKNVGCHDSPLLNMLSQSHKVFITHYCLVFDACHPLTE